MKYSNYIGISTAVLIIIVCFIPWVFIAPIQLTITGLHTGHTDLGRPGLMNILMAVVSIVLFIVPSITAKRTNLFIGAFNVAWAIRNYFVVTLCQMGECPEKKPGIYLLVILSVILLLMTFFPKIDVNKIPVD